MRFSRAFSWMRLPVCLLLAGCAGRTFGPTSFRGSPPIYMGRPQTYPPVAAPVLPTQPVGTPTTPNQPVGPSAGQPSDLDTSLQPTMLKSTFVNGPGYGQVAMRGQMIDGRAAPLGIPQTVTPRKVAFSNPDPAHQQSGIAASGEDGGASTPLDDVKFRGGKTIKDLTYVNIFIGGPTRWSNVERQWIDYALEAGMTDPYLNHVVMQYFNNQPISANFHGSFWMSGYQPQRVTQDNVRQVAKLLYQQGSFRGLSMGSTVVNFLLPPGAILEDPDAGRGALSNLSRTIPTGQEVSSSNGLGGYHGSVRIDAQTTVYYSVVAYAERLPNGKTNGIPAFPESWKSVAATAYHQLQETRTDPDVDDAIQSGKEQYLGWSSDRGQEIGDNPVETAQTLSQAFMEVPLADGSGMIPIQLIYSNAVHGPEGPITKPYGGSPLPPATRKTPRPGSNNPTPTPSNPSGPDPLLQTINDEWSKLPDATKRQVIQLIQQALNQQPFGT